MAINIFRDDRFQVGMDGYWEPQYFFGPYLNWNRTRYKQCDHFPYSNVIFSPFFNSDIFVERCV